MLNELTVYRGSERLTSAEERQSNKVEQKTPKSKWALLETTSLTRLVWCEIVNEKEDLRFNAWAEDNPYTGPLH